MTKRKDQKIDGKKCSKIYHILKSNPPWAAKKGAKTRDSTAMSLMRMLSDGPEVSLRGSPTVSPITAALCASEPLGPRDLACSEAPAYQNTKDYYLNK